MNDESLCGLAFQGRGLKLNLLINQNQIGDVEDNWWFLVGLETLKLRYLSSLPNIYGDFFDSKCTIHMFVQTLSCRLYS